MTRGFKHFTFVLFFAHIIGGLSFMNGDDGSDPTFPEGPDLSEEVKREARRLYPLPDADGSVCIAHELILVDPNDSRRQVPDGISPGDPLSPANHFRSILSSVQAIEVSLKRTNSRDILVQIENAWNSYSEGSERLTHLRGTASSLKQLQMVIESTSRRLIRMPEEKTLLKELRAIEVEVANLGLRMATDILNGMIVAGVSRRRLKGPTKSLINARSLALKKAYVASISSVGSVLRVPIGTIVFDKDLYLANIQNALSGQVVGYGLSIAINGQPFPAAGGVAEGLARTTADNPETAQGFAKIMHVVSVSKTITTIITLRLLQGLGKTPQEKVADYLPSNWELGDGVAELTFVDFLTHRSGFGQQNAGNTYSDLKAAIANDVGSTSFDYSNGNFGLMRVVSAGLMGFDLAVFELPLPIFPASLMAALLFTQAASSLFSQISPALANDLTCSDSSSDETIQYNFPHNNDPGYLEPSRFLECGGIGWHASANNLANIMTHLRNTNVFLSTTMRNSMQDDFLGYMDPINYSWYNPSPYGVDYLHGGDWFHGPGEAHACVIAHPIQVETGLVINSERGSIGGYQCRMLQDAFNNAWVPSS